MIACRAILLAEMVRAAVKAVEAIGYGDLVLRDWARVEGRGRVRELYYETTFRFRMQTLLFKKIGRDMPSTAFPEVARSVSVQTSLMGCPNRPGREFARPCAYDGCQSMLQLRPTCLLRE